MCTVSINQSISLYNYFNASQTVSVYANWNNSCASFLYFSCDFSERCLLCLVLGWWSVGGDSGNNILNSTAVRTARCSTD